MKSDKYKILNNTEFLINSYRSAVRAGRYQIPNVYFLPSLI